MTWKPDLEQLAEEVKNAPSIFNSQPWFFEVSDDDRIDLYSASTDAVGRVKGLGPGSRRERRSSACSPCA